MKRGKGRAENRENEKKKNVNEKIKKANWIKTEIYEEKNDERK